MCLDQNWSRCPEDRRSAAVSCANLWRSKALLTPKGLQGIAQVATLEHTQGFDRASSPTLKGLSTNCESSFVRVGPLQGRVSKVRKPRN